MSAYKQVGAEVGMGNHTHRLTMKTATRSVAILAVIGGAVASPAKRWPSPSPALELNKYDREIFDVAMQLGDWSWEPSTGYIEANDDGVSSPA
jgi:hypothetical protein